MIIAKEMVVANRKKTDIITDLRKHKFRPFPKIAVARESGEVEEAEADVEEETGDANDFDYLLGMAIWSLTKEKVSCFRGLGVLLADGGEYRLSGSRTRRGRKRLSCSSFWKRHPRIFGTWTWICF